MPVTFFLLTVLALTALIMVVFGVLHALRALRARAQRRRRDRFQRRLGAALIIVLGLVTFAFTAWVSDYFLRLSACL